MSIETSQRDAAATAYAPVSEARADGAGEERSDVEDLPGAGGSSNGGVSWTRGRNGTLGRVVGTLLGSGILRAAAVYGGAGVGFALANLLMARVLEPVEYGTVALVVAIFNFTIPSAPLGADGIVLRRRLPLSQSLLARALFSALVMAGIVLVTSILLYDLAVTMALLLFLGVAAGGVGVVSAAYFQSTSRKGLALLISQGQNVVLLAFVVLLIATGMHSAYVPITGMVAFYFVGAVLLWMAGLGERRSDVNVEAAAERFPTREALSYAGVVGAAYGLVQAERLVLPGLLGLEALAVFGVLAAVVGSAFRVLLLAVGFTLVPDLRRAATVQDRRRVIRREALAVGAVVCVATVALWFLTPVIVRFFVGDKYVLGPALIAASIVAGWFKVMSAFGRASVSSLAGARTLSRFNIACWVSVCMSLLGAVLGRPWGLTGVVWGLSAGWLSLTLSAAYYAAPYFRLSDAEHDIAAPARMPHVENPG